MKTEHNINRIQYLLSLYNMTREDLLSSVNEGFKKKIEISDIYSEEISLNVLKRIDKIFNKGLNFYLDPKDIEVNKEASIFFRKNHFNSDLNIGAKKIVNHFEELKLNLSTISKLSDLSFERKIEIYKTSDSPLKVANELRGKLYPEFTLNSRDFLKGFIGKLGANNVFVFEFIETWNKKEKANIDGFFLQPNFIVLKRQQKSFKREIFTLAHELGHYLLNKEEVEQVTTLNIASENLSKIERWCNDFAYYFLINNYEKFINEIKFANSQNDYYLQQIKDISKFTHLSKLSLYTRLLYENKISKSSYNNISEDFDNQYQFRIAEENRKKELDKLNGIKMGGAVPKPINSPLFVSTIQTAYYEGVINEYEVCKRLNIKLEKLETYL
ncbi:ImmA/IrrE family metallo-endopeptidase [Flavobacterium sp. K77]|uniref:ImmA/IrrE family metallo-endopeptidase n=1 Tax=Flavobacterium sp. K77 TaxID=2910676 RepID=UPI001F3D95FB|nr:ImmA/IrrE family metallo-endopeptidase [Flavobacterium sp. K77]MCF6141608.1 ImmA/IrrE family metallo-endopeptidase [Flavobacterium sp. K77]